MINLNITPLFPTAVLSDLINRPFTDSEINVIKSNESKVYKNQGNLISLNNYVLEEPEMKNLKEICLKYLEIYMKQIYQAQDDVTIFITQSWINYSYKNNWHHRHSHPNSFLSGVIYFNANKNDSIKFHSSKYYAFDLNPKFQNEFNSQAFMFRVENRKIIIFPSSLEHEVPEINENDTRISLAFNSFIKGNLGNGSALNELKIC